MCQQTHSEWVAWVVPAASGLIGAVLGGWLSWWSAEKHRRKQSLYFIADLFMKEAGEWSAKTYDTHDPNFHLWHNQAIWRLSPHVTYIRAKHPEVGVKIWPDWVQYHGGDADRPIDVWSYVRDGKTKGKDEWVVWLYSIADILRKS